MSSRPRVSVIVLTYEGKELLRRFLPSIASQTFRDYEVIIFDNASKDDSVSFLEEHFPDFRVVVNQTNEGTALGTNLGVRHACGELLLLISNDMELDPSFMEEMLATMDSDSTIGIVGCKMMKLGTDDMHTRTIDNVGGNVDLFGFPYVRGHDEDDRGQWDRESDVFFAFGGGMLVRKRLYEELRGFDAAFFTLADDIDLSWRCRLLGYRVVVNPRAVLHHRVSATLATKFKREWCRYLAERNTCRMLLKNYSAVNLVWVMPCYFLILLAEVSFFVVTFRRRMARAVVKAIAWNIRHLSETLRERRYAQSLRRCPDRIVMRYMHRKSAKIVVGMESIRTGLLI